MAVVKKILNLLEEEELTEVVRKYPVPCGIGGKTL